MLDWQPKRRRNRFRVDWSFVSFWFAAAVFCGAFWLAIAKGIAYYCG